MPRKLLFLTARTGAGHDSAAAAVAEAVRLVSTCPVDVRITHPIEDSHALNRFFCSTYNWLLRRRQHWVRHYFRLINALRPNERRLYYRLWRQSGIRFIEAEDPDMVVSFHPMTNHFCAWLLKERRFAGRIPMAVVMTDPVPEFWRGWICHEVDRYYVPTEQARQELERWGIAGHRVRCLGMPVHPRFAGNAGPRYSLREKYGLLPHSFTVFVNAGAFGGDHFLEIYRRLLGLQLPLQSVLLCGDNRSLEKKARQLSALSKMPTRVVGTTPIIDELMDVADVMITKPGGLTCFEAFARNLPLLVNATRQLMPQEAGMARLIEQQGLGVVLRHGVDLERTLRDFMNGEFASSMRRRIAAYSRPGAALDIARNLVGDLVVGVSGGNQTRNATSGCRQASVGSP